MLLPDIDSFQAAVHHDKLEYTLLVSMLYMHMYWLMFIGVEVEYKSEVFVYFRHIVVIVSRCKDTQNYSSGKINVAMRRKKTNILRKICGERLPSLLSKIGQIESC